MKLFLLGLLMLCAPAVGLANASASKVRLEPFYFQTAKGQRLDLMIEIANTMESRENGLMFRESLDKNSGMLFQFDDEQNRAFWMRNTLIPLDMVFMNRQGVITQIYQNAIPHDETLIKSDAPAFAVLEINGGRAAELGLKPGDVAHHVTFGNMLADDKAIQ